LEIVARRAVIGPLVMANVVHSLPVAMLRVVRAVIVGRVLRLGIVARRAVIGLLVMANVVHSLPVAMLRVVRAAIAGRVLRLGIVARRVVIGPPVVANVARSLPVAMLRVVRAVIAGRVLRLGIVALRAVIGPPAMVNVVRSLPVVPAATAAPVRRLATAVRRVTIGLPAMANVARSARATMPRVVRAAIVRLALRLTIEADHAARAMIAGRVRRSATAALRVAIGLPATANVVPSRRVAMLRGAPAAIAVHDLPLVIEAHAHRLATAAPPVATAPQARANAVRSKPAKIRAAQAAIARPAHRSVTEATARRRANATTHTMAARVPLPPIANAPRAIALT
jgi:hypothetical protein